ncbi:MAG TPA: hypothetical protein VJB34_01735 [Bdellovibrionota bacterium]|nr:hypothetical protein [Bdellovibrionota bacterium]
MAKITLRTSIEELAGIVAHALEKFNINAVLSGGACVSIYTENKYVSGDLDFVSHEGFSKIDKAMETIGFKRKGRYYTHPHTKLFVEFPPGPLSIGDLLIREGTTKKVKTGIVKLLTPTQCVMDRLAAFYFWNDKQGLDQALMVASKQKIDIHTIQQWSLKEKEIKKFEIFKQKLSSFKKRV